jgi:hypothetical protein
MIILPYIVRIAIVAMPVGGSCVAVFISWLFCSVKEPEIQ